MWLRVAAAHERMENSLGITALDETQRVGRWFVHERVSPHLHVCRGALGDSAPRINIHACISVSASSEKVYIKLFVALITTSTLSFSLVKGSEEPVSPSLFERWWKVGGEETLYLLAPLLFSAPVWLSLVSGCGTEFLISQAFCWVLHPLNSTPPPPSPFCSPLLWVFIYLSLHAWLPRCLRSENVSAWQTGECGQTFVVSRQQTLRCKLVWGVGGGTVNLSRLLCGRRGEHGKQSMHTSCLTKQTYTNQELFDSFLIGPRIWESAHKKTINSCFKPSLD